MRIKVLIGVMVVSIIGIAINHLLLDWNQVSKQKIERHFDELIDEQYNDLIGWSISTISQNEFQKRRYCNNELVQWNDDKAWPATISSSKLSVIQDENGIFLEQRIDDQKSCYNISVYPLFESYPIANKYLKSRKNIFLPKSLYALSLSSGNHNYKGLFYYDIKESPSRSLDVIFGFFIFLVVLILVWSALEQNFLRALIVLIVVRVASLYLSVLEGFIRYPLFDPLYFTSSVWNPTLGDLFINAFLLFLIILNWSRRFRNKEYRVTRYRLLFLQAIGLAISILVFSTQWSLLDNSQLSMDVGKSIVFDIQRIIAYGIVLLLAGSQFLISFRLVGSLRSVDNVFRHYYILIGASSIVMIVSLPEGLVALLFSIIIIATSQFKWGTRLKEFKYQNLLFALFVSIGISFVLAFSVYKFHEKSELEAKKKFVNHLLIKRDILGEYYLNEAFRRLEENDSTNSESIDINELKQVLTNAYFDKYHINIVDSLDRVGYSSLLEDWEVSLSSDYPKIHFLDEGSNVRYLSLLSGYIVSLKLKERVPISVFPALLTDDRYSTATSNFDYAVFKDGAILFQKSRFGQGEWPEGKDFQDSRLYNQGIEKNEKHYWGVSTTDGRVILVISQKYGTQMQLTNFSFFLLLNLFFIGAIVLMSSLSLREAPLNFTGKIQLYLGLAFIIPLFIAGFALLNSLNASYKEEINRNYLKRALYLSDQLGDASSGLLRKQLTPELIEISNFIQADISIYDSRGYLLSSSQSEIFDLGLQSRLINPIVFEELIAKENQSMIADESIGSLEYKVSYATINGEDGELAGFLAMPFFDSKNHLRRQQLEVFGSLVTVFGFIFILAILFGNLVLNNLMQPLRLVADKIRQVTLQEENKPINYESSDEIGSLVKDYNSMLVKLEESKEALARSQKETAWKEIARQVAHEIKNPLTPMQLKIQQLLRKQDPDSKDGQTLSGLLQQVETLSQIAGSFSAFAEMPAPNNTRFDLGQLANQVISLYLSNEVEIDTSIEEEVMINADKDIFQRILNNVVLNAIQSVDGKQVKLEVKLLTKPGKCELTVKDNGKGIQVHLRDKIFMNYFSTKSSGSGIGLALAKKGIENAGGNIWFESSEGKGTTFYISMPLADS